MLDPISIGMVGCLFIGAAKVLLTAIKVINETPAEIKKLPERARQVKSGALVVVDTTTKGAKKVKEVTLTSIDTVRNLRTKFKAARTAFNGNPVTDPIDVTPAPSKGKKQAA